MKNAKSLLAFGVAAAMALAATGCGGSATSASSAAESTSSASQATEAESASAGSGTLNIMLETPVESLDPQLATDGTSFEVIADYTDGLMQMDADGAAVPACAESYEVSEDGTTYTFHIREDAVWSNGDPVTANDFVFAWQRAVDPANASEYSYMLSDIGQIVNAAEIIAGEKDSHPVENAKVVVAGGRGIRTEEEWAKLHELADLLGAAVGCSRPIAELGWEPHSHQIGQTGKGVAPKIYFALGISGAMQHMCAVNADIVIAVNKDPKAPIMEMADYAVEADLKDFLPLLIEKIKALKSK